MEFKIIILLILAVILFVAEWAFQTHEEITAFFILGKGLLISTTLLYLEMKK